MVKSIKRSKKRRWFTNSAVLMARLVDRHGSLLNPAVVKSIDFVAVVVDEAGVVRPVACLALDPREVVLDGLRNDEAWSVDAVGYNFCHQFDLSSISFPRDAPSCEIRYVIRDASGEISVVRFQVGVINHDGY